MEYTLLDFNLSQASAGASLGYKDRKGNLIFADKVDFNNQESVDRYAGYVTFSGDRTIYGFYGTGECYDKTGQYCMTLKIVDATITKTTGTKIARVTDSNGNSNARPINKTATVSSDVATMAEDSNTEEIFSIATLQPREEIAMHCLGSMIGKYDNPLGIDNAKIKQLVSKAYLFAQEFINQAVLYREKETTSSTVESNKYASVDSDSLSSDTDKLLYNISTALTNMMAQSKNQYADQQKNGLNVNTHVDGTVNAVISGSVTTKQETTSADT